MLTLIAIVSITSLVFLGGTVTEMLSAVGMSV
jgi:Flp pilus assembly pilin Flp